MSDNDAFDFIPGPVVDTSTDLEYRLLVLTFPSDRMGGAPDVVVGPRELPPGELIKEGYELEEVSPEIGPGGNFTHTFNFGVDLG